MILILIALGVVIAVIIGISRLPLEKFNPNNTENAYAAETKPLTKQELLQSAVKALDQGNRELAKKLVEQAESMRD